AKTPDSLVALAWNWFTLSMGIDLLLPLRPLNLRGWDDRAVTPCRPKDKPAVESLPAAFCENFEQCGISAIIAARREDPAAYRRACVALLMLLADARTNRVRNKFWRAPRAISVGQQPAPSGRADDFRWPRDVVNVEPAAVEPARDTAAS